jgi:hypothetical protein
MAKYPLGWPYDYLHVETGTKVQGLDTIQARKGIRHYVSNAIRDVLRKEQRLQREGFESAVCDSALWAWRFAQMGAGQVS